ncbi:MAG: YtxH domain-containing protein [Anaerolineae bacterium]|nr:YtxH domain-containing protein [Anaerolineae bacterium]
MRKLVSWLIGFSLGAAVAAMVVFLFAPFSGDELIARFKRGWQEALAEASKANNERRAELEAELAQMRKTYQLPETTTPPKM